MFYSTALQLLKLFDPTWITAYLWCCCFFYWWCNYCCCVPYCLSLCEV